MKFNEKLMSLRKKEGLSQEELGYKLDVTRQTISKWEIGQTTPEMDRIVEMSKIFNISVDELINESEVTPVQNTVIEDQPIQKESTKDNKKTVIIIVGVLIIVIILIIGIGKIFDTERNSTLDKFFDMFNKTTDAQENKASGIFDKATNIIEQVTKEQDNSSSTSDSMSNEISSIIDNAANTINQTTSQYDDIEKRMEIGRFNGAIEIFSGSNNGVSVKEILDKVITSNKTKDRKITVKYVKEETQDESEIKNIKQNMGNFVNYEVTFEYDIDGFINKAIIENMNQKK